MSVFTVSTGEGDVELTMQAVADALRNWKGGGAPSPGPLRVPEWGRLRSQARQLTLQSNIDSNAIIHSTRPGVGPWIIRFQIGVRRLTWWFVEPIVQQTRRFQANVARVLDGLAGDQERLRNQVAEMADLNQRVEALEGQMEALHDRPGGPDERDAEEA